MTGRVRRLTGGGGQLLERIQPVYSDSHGSDRGDRPIRDS